jgi:hypothetical protein
MADYEHKEYSIGFTPKQPETDEEMRVLLLSARESGVRVELDSETYSRFKPMIEEFERNAYERQ